MMKHHEAKSKGKVIRLLPYFARGFLSIIQFLDFLRKFSEFENSYPAKEQNLSNEWIIVGEGYVVQSLSYRGKPEKRHSLVYSRCHHSGHI